MKDLDAMIDFFLYEKGENIKINGADQVALIVDAVDKPTYYNDKIIRCKCEIKTGDIIGYNNLNYIIISQVDKKEKSYKARIRKCSYRIAFNFTGNVKWFDVIEESKVFDVSTGTYISVSTGNIYITMQYNADTRSIALSQRFLVTNQPFKVTGIDKSQDGLIKFNCTLDALNTTYDDVENNIIDRWKYEVTHTYTLAINNGDVAKVLLNEVFNLNYLVTDNGSTVANPAITFTSSDPNYVSVDNTGKIMGTGMGQALITTMLTYHNTIKETITVNTVDTLTHSYSIAIIGSTTIKLATSQSYVAQIYDNGQEVFDKAVTWSIKNQDGTTGTAYASITSSTGNAVTIKAVTSSSYANKYVVLKATLSDDATIYKEFVIQLKTS